MNALVTGATGFLGDALARRLQQTGWQVTGLGRNPTVGKELSDRGIRFIQADLRDRQAIIKACADQEIVFHCGAAVGTWGDSQYFYDVNVGGTDNIVAGCQLSGTRRLIYVSTPSIYFSTQDRFNVKEDDPLPSPINIYAATKLTAERVIARAHRDGLPVISIRPRAIFGPGDTTIFPRILTALQSGRLPRIGDGKNVQDLSYIDNVVDALLLCAASPAFTLGRTYNISNGQPTRIWEVIDRLCRELSLPMPTRKVPLVLPFALASLLELSYKLLRISQEPPITRYSISMLARSMTLDISSARRDLGYVPKVSVEDGIERFIGWWKIQEARLGNQHNQAKA
ncbi:MAG: NAD-dependent epimerase/dehydratase family protein [Caldilineaceae bacterium]